MKTLRLAFFILISAAYGFGQGANCGLQGVCTGNLTATNDAVILPVQPTTGTAYVTISGSWTGTIDFLESGDGGQHFSAATATDGSTISTTSNGQWRFAISGATNFEVKASSISGSATVRINQSSGAPSSR